MDGKQILGFLNYSILGLIFMLGLISLVVIGQKRKLTFLFLMLLCAGIASFLFFAGLAFIVPATVLLLFCLILFLLINSQEYYSLGQHSYAENLFKKPAKGSVTGIILNIMISIFFPALFGYIFFKYTRDFYKNITLVENFNTSQMTAIIDDISSDYVPLMLVIICGLTVSIFWFIAILNFRRRKN